MPFNDDASDRNWKKGRASKVKSVNSESDTSLNKTKQGGKFCLKWFDIFKPWIGRCKDNANIPFCRACQCRLDANRCRLQRHQETSKHSRNLEIFLREGEEAARKNHNLHQERNKYYQQRKKSNTNEERGTTKIPEVNLDSADEHIEDDQIIDETPMQQLKTEAVLNNRKHRNNTYGVIQKSAPAPTKTDRIQLLMQIQREKQELMESFKELVGINNLTTLPAATSSPPKDKNHVDLFFESVSSSVKALSPKLIAEAKMRVSQLICELELRALTEENVATGAVVESPYLGKSFVVNATQ